MYTRIALGKNSAMDVVSGESSGSHGQLLLLYPLLFLLQGLQMYIGGLMMTHTYPALLSTEGFLVKFVSMVHVAVSVAGDTDMISATDVSPEYWSVLLIRRIHATFMETLTHHDVCVLLQDPESRESDLWGSRGVFIAGIMMIYMAVRNFHNTVATIIGKQSSQKRRLNKLLADVKKDVSKSS